MKNNQFIFALMLGTALETANVYAVDNYQNCYGAANCMTLADFANQKIEEFANSEYARYAGDKEWFLDAARSDTEILNNSSNLYISVSDDGKDVSIYAPTEGNAVDLPTLTFYDDVSIANRPLLSGVTNLSITGNVNSIPGSFLYSNEGQYDTSPVASLEKVTLPDSVTSIGDGAFAYTGLKEFTVPTGVTSIGGSAFADTDITELVIPDSVTSLSGGAFREMHNLEKLVLPNAEIEQQFFGGLENLKEITVPDTLALHYFDSHYGDEIPFNRMDEMYANGEISLELYEQAKAYRDHLLSEGFCIEEAPECIDVETYYQPLYKDIASVFGDLDMSKITIHCSGDLEKCKANMAQAGYEEGSYNMVQATPKSSNTEVKNADGSTTIYDKDGNFLGFKGKRIYTIDEANEIAGTTNHVKIRYR